MVENTIPWLCPEKEDEGQPKSGPSPLVGDPLSGALPVAMRAGVIKDMWKRKLMGKRMSSPRVQHSLHMQAGFPLRCNRSTPSARNFEVAKLKKSNNSSS